MPQQLSIVKSEPLPELKPVASHDSRPRQRPGDAGQPPIGAPRSQTQPPLSVTTSDLGGEGFLKETWKRVNPMEALNGLSQAFYHPVDTGKAMLQAQGVPLQAAQDAYGRGDYVDAGRSFANYLIPVLGPEMQRQGDLLSSGDIPSGLGAMFGTGMGVFGPAAAAGMRLTRGMTQPNPQTAQAVRAGQAAGVPVDAATATGNRFVGAAQQVIDRQPGGALVSGRAQVAQERGLTRMGEDLANRSHPTPVTPELAGAGVREAVTNRVTTFAGEADTAYDTLRQLEQQRATPVQVRTNAPGQPIGPPTTQHMVAVDLKAARDALTPVYQDLLRQSELAPGQMMGDKARALVALDRIMKAPDLAPLSVVDGALSDLKAFVRKADSPQTRTAGQGAVAQIVQQLDNAVIGAAKRAGSDVLQALQEGRRATVAKFRSKDVLDTLTDEPVQTFRGATRPQDASIEHLRAIAAETPQELPKLGRAVLDDLLGQATADGGFKNAASVATKWERLGPKTKQLLYADPAYVRDLDDFFQLSRRMSEVPNPSGTAPTALAVTGGMYVLYEPVTGIPVQLSMAGLSKLLHSPGGVRLLTEGLRLPAGKTARNLGWFSQLSRMAGEDLQASAGGR